jgi:FkbM family methyltransferase
MEKIKTNENINEINVFDELKNSYGWLKDVHLYLFALGSTNECRAFHIMRLPEMSSFLSPEPWLQQLSPDHKYDFDLINVECRTLDRVCYESGVDSIDILKIDVQGAELDVLNGGISMLTTGAVGMIYLEVTLAESYVNQMKLRDLLEFLEPKGYRLWDILPFVYTDAGRVWTANALFLNSKMTDMVEERSRCQKKF